MPKYVLACRREKGTYNEPQDRGACEPLLPDSLHFLVKCDGDVVEEHHWVLIFSDFLMLKVEPSDWRTAGCQRIELRGHPENERE